MPILSDNPKVIEPAAPVVYDQWWIQSMTVFAADPNAPTRVVVDLCRGRVLENGATELDPTAKAKLRVPDLFALAATNPAVAAAMAQLVDAIGVVAKAEGVIS
jgi:hypothetical protein